MEKSAQFASSSSSPSLRSNEYLPLGSPSLSSSMSETSHRPSTSDQFTRPGTSEQSHRGVGTAPSSQGWRVGLETPPLNTPPLGKIRLMKSSSNLGIAMPAAYEEEELQAEQED